MRARQDSVLHRHTRQRHCGPLAQSPTNRPTTLSNDLRRPPETAAHIRLASRSSSGLESQ